MTPAVGREVRVDRDRLWNALMELKEIGGYDEGDLTRPAAGTFACATNRPAHA